MKLIASASKSDPITRRYGDSSGVAHALELIGERWALLVLRELMFGPRRFCELRKDLPRLSANVLSRRLHQLQVRGLIGSASAPAQLYEATKWAREILGVIRSLALWAGHDGFNDPEQFISPASVLMMMEEYFVPQSAWTARSRVGLCLNGENFVVAIRNGTLRMRRAAMTKVDVAIIGTTKQMMRQIARQSLDGTMQVEGNLHQAQDFLTFFHHPGAGRGQRNAQ